MGRQLRIVVALLVAGLMPLAGWPIATDAATVPTVTAISAGYGHTCALTTNGVAKCWGYGLHGALGNGAAISSRIPVDVTGLTGGVSEISAASFYSCAVTNAGGVMCWGRNRTGQLGDDTTTSSIVPVNVSGLTSGVTAISASDDRNCALTSGGGVKCWGFDFSALGSGSPSFSVVPFDVPGLKSGVSAIAASGTNACALTTGGGVKCWGYGDVGQLGNGTTSGSSTPVDVFGLTSGVTAIATGGGHTCALVGGGGVRCWGQSDHGQLGNGTTKASLVPVEVAGLTTGITAISTGRSHTCAITSRGGVKCWGLNEFEGQLGDGTRTTRSLPVSVTGLTSGVTAISAGYGHTCALTSTGGAKCWGGNTYGQLGDGTRTNSSVPVNVDFATHQTVALRASEPPGTLASGTAVTFSASVRPLGPAGERATVRFEVYRQENGVWRLAARRDVVADATGRATLRWTFATIGSRYVRARALENAIYGASGWSARVHYSVG